MINLDTQDDFQIYLEMDKRSKIYVRIEGEEDVENKFECLQISQESKLLDIS